MVFNVRCFKCGEPDVRLILGGRAIIHARCHGCESNLLAEVMEFEQEVIARVAANSEMSDDICDGPPTAASISAASLEEESVPASN